MVDPNPKKNIFDNNWITLYPAYFNSILKISEGRKLKKEFCVPNPTCENIMKCINQLSLDCDFEPKAYPRNPLEKGRVKVLIKKDNSFINPELNKSILKKKRKLCTELVKF